MSCSQMVNATEATEVKLSVTLPPMAERLDTVCPLAKGENRTTGGTESAVTVMLAEPVFVCVSVADAASW